jgi:hypothetical protein
MRASILLAAALVASTAYAAESPPPKPGSPGAPAAPNLGAKPPAGAVVLIPFEEGKPPSMDTWTNPNWVPQADGSVLPAKGDNRTKREFGDIRLHVEFFIPPEPDARNEDRGNSGVYIHDLYEIQILDSFGQQPAKGSCGAVYLQTAPRVNACLPPGKWQAYDITFRAPRFDEAGKKVKDAVVSVDQNGVTVHDKQAIAGPTGQARGRPEVKKAPLRLQEHGHPVRFRNVWIVELPEEGAPGSPGAK